MKNFVYVIGAMSGPQKIGIAGDVSRRLKSIQTGSHEPIKVAFSIEASGTAEMVENYAHWLLREKRLEGEWFKVAPDEAVAAVHTAIEAVARGERKERVVKNVGRKKEFPVRILLPLTDEMAEGIDEARGDEDRVAWIRAAIAKRLKKKG